MKSKQYRLSIVNDKIVLKEAAEDISTEKFTNIASKAITSTLGVSLTAISSLFSTYAYIIKSIVNIASPKSVKDKINKDFNKKLKDLSRSYERSLDNIKLDNGHDFVRFMFSPSLYAYEEMRENIREKSGVVFENINDFLDDPFSYAVNFIPDLIDNVTANDIKRNDFLSDKDILDTRGNINNLMKNLRDVSPQRLEQILQDVKLNKNQQKTLEMFTKQASKKVNKESYLLKISTNLLLEEKNASKEEVLSMINKLTSEIDKYSSLVLGIYKKKLDDPESTLSKAINKNVSNQSKSIDVDKKKLIKDYSDNVLNLVYYYQFYYTVYAVMCSLFESLDKFKIKNLSQLKTFVEATNKTLNKINEINYNSSYVNSLKKEIEPEISKLRSFLNSLDQNKLEEEIKKIQSNKEIDENTSLITVLSEISNDINFKDDIETAISFLKEVSSDEEMLEKMRNETAQFKEVLNFMKENNILDNEVNNIMKNLEKVKTGISFSELINRFEAVNRKV